MTNIRLRGNTVERNLDEILSTSRRVRDALHRGRALNAIDTPPVYCYAAHVQEVRDLFRLVFVMTPLYVCATAEQIPDTGNPIFAYAATHSQPVPQEFWDRLAAAGALYLRIGDKA